MRIYLGSDHAGFALKGTLKPFLIHRGYEVEDMGAHTCDPDDDYPDFIAPVAEAVSENPHHTRGIVLGGSGQGEAMLANRYRNVRCAVYYGGPIHIISLSREHNDANMLSLGARFVSEDDAKRAVALWLETKHPKSERYDSRIEDMETRTTSET